MKTNTKWALGAVAAVVAAIAIQPLRAQVYPVPQVVSVGPNDLIPIIPNGVPSAQSQYATASQINGVPGYVQTVPLTAFSLAFANGQSWYLIKPAGTLATGTFTFSPNPGQGQRNCMRSTQTQTAVTLAAGTGQTIVSPITAMTANTTYCYIWNAPTSTWDAI